MSGPEPPIERPKRARAPRRADRLDLFRMCGAGVATVAGLLLPFIHAWLGLGHEKGTSSTSLIGVDWGSIGYFAFCFLLVLLFLYKEVGGLAKDIVEGIRAYRDKGNP